MIDPLKQFPGYALRRASAAMRAELTARLASHDLRTPEASILLLIGANPGITQSDLCRMLDIQSANMTPMIARLHQRDLLLRSAVDGRSQGLALTAEGDTLEAAARAEMAAHEALLLARIPAAHRAGFLAGLAALWEA